MEDGSSTTTSSKSILAETITWLYVSKFVTIFANFLSQKAPVNNRLFYFHHSLVKRMAVLHSKVLRNSFLQNIDFHPTGTEPYTSFPYHCLEFT